MGLSTGSPMEELEKELKELKGFGGVRERTEGAEGDMQPHRKNNNINQLEPPELPGTKPLTKEYTWRDP